jgi:hypothetical protein
MKTNSARANIETCPDNKASNKIIIKNYINTLEFENEYDRWKDKLNNISKMEFYYFIKNQKDKKAYYNYNINITSHDNRDATLLINTIKTMISNYHPNIYFNNYNSEKIID